LTFCSQSTLKVSIQSKMFFSLVLSLTQIYSKKSVTFFPPALLSNCSCIIFYFFTFSFTVALQEWPAASSHKRTLFSEAFRARSCSVLEGRESVALAYSSSLSCHELTATLSTTDLISQVHFSFFPPSHATNSLALCRPPTSFRARAHTSTHTHLTTQFTTDRFRV
jgi:hypothetical protein